VLCYNTARCITDYENLVVKYGGAGGVLEPPDVLITGEGTQIWWREKPGSSQTGAGVSSHGHDPGRATFVLDSEWRGMIQKVWWGCDQGGSGGRGVLKEGVEGAAAEEGTAETRGPAAEDIGKQHQDVRQGEGGGKKAACVLDVVTSKLDPLDECVIESLNHSWEARYAITLRCDEAEAKASAARLSREINAILTSGSAGTGVNADSGSSTTPAGELKVVSVSSMPGWGSTPPLQLIGVIPAMAGKGKAAQYVAAKLGFSESDCLAAGDTLGDVSMLGDTGMEFVCVANASQGLKEATASSANSGTGHLVRNDGANGVLEGLRCFQSRCWETL
jgi:hypothetical protein